MRLYHAIASTALLCLAAAYAGSHNPLDYVLTRDIVWERRFVPELSPGGQPTIERVNLDLSLDGGATWSRRLAHGLPSEYGTNHYRIALRITPDLWSEQARIGLRTLWASTTNTILLHDGDKTPDITIAGVRILSPVPGQIIEQPSYIDLVVHKAGPSTIDIGYRTPGDGWSHYLTIDAPSATNVWSIPILGFPEGNVEIIAVAYSNLYYSVPVVITNLYQ